MLPQRLWKCTTWEYWEDLYQNFGRLTCKVQHDLYHRFTADVHVLRCIEILDQIFQGKRPGAQHYLEALRKNEVPGLLYSDSFYS